jgi:hypothetical protein
VFGYLRFYFLQATGKTRWIGLLIGTIAVLTVVMNLYLAIFFIYGMLMGPVAVGGVVMSAETEKEIQQLRQLVPLKIEPPIMYWRPQKVGTSTIFSILLSYSFRYNMLLRRKGFKNSFCMRIIQCGERLLKKQLSLTSDKLPQTTTKSSVQASVVKKKLNGYNRPLNSREKNQELLSEQNWFSIVGTHNLCNMPAQYVTAGLKCAFQNNITFLGDQTSHMRPASARSGSNRQNSTALLEMLNAHFHSSPLLSQLVNVDRVNELFSVREPVSRMISCYYFWGELTMMKMNGAKSIGSSKPKLRGNSSGSDGISWGSKVMHSILGKD